MWWILAILSALTQLLRNIIMKDIGHNLDEYINVWGRFTFLLPFALIPCLYNGIPPTNIDYWLYAVLAGLLVIISTLFLSKAFKLTNISIATALWKINVLVLVILGILFLNENINFLGILGILITVLGVYFLNIKQSRVSLIYPFTMLLKDKGLLYALIAGILLAPVTIFYKKTIILSNDIYYPVLTNALFASLFMTPIMLKKSAHHIKHVSNHFSKFLLMGFFAATSTIFTTYALSLTVAAYVEAVKQIEIVLALFGGIIFFKEYKRAKEIWFGCLIIMFGIMILILSNTIIERLSNFGKI